VPVFLQIDAFEFGYISLAAATRQSVAVALQLEAAGPSRASLVLPGGLLRVPEGRKLPRSSYPIYFIPSQGKHHLRNVQTGCLTHPASHPTGTGAKGGGDFLGNKVMGRENND
jgi:hypothetical protein